MSGLFGQLFGLLKASRKVSSANVPMGDLKAGALYSVYNGDESRKFGIVKILVIEPAAIHIRIYNGVYDERPDHVDPATLTCGIEAEVFQKAIEENKIGEIFAAQGFSTDHMPVAPRDFIYGWQPVIITESPVTEDELEGYKYWQQEGGGVFGTP